jgi:isoprenylcysteine carboxyl methyltransferase (ICMT) family protein YpbQ
MTAAVAVPLIVLLAVLVMMLAELWLSTTNERVLLANGAVQADDPVYGVMRIAYPASSSPWRSRA